MKENSIKTYPTISCCGLDCGLCPTYYTIGPSRCPGCGGLNFFNKHPSCSILTCCAKKKNYETCAECIEFPCSKLKGWDVHDSFISHKKSIENLNYIKENSLEEFLEQQEERIKILELMLKDYNEGRSKSIYCIATALISIEALKKALKEAEILTKADEIDLNDVKAKAKILKGVLTDLALRDGIELKLRKKKKS